MSAPMSAFGGKSGLVVLTLSCSHPDPKRSSRGPFAYRNYDSAAKEQHHSGVIPANLTTLPHFSLSSAKSFPNSAGVLTKTLPPKSASRARIFGSARPALISLLSLLTISAGVFLGAPVANQALVS